MNKNKVSKTTTADALEKLINFVEEFRKSIDYYGVDGYYREAYYQDIKELEGRVAFSRAVLAKSKKVKD